jgi:type I restriction enzyme S subunit
MYSMRSPYYFDATRNDMYGVAITRVTLAKIQNSLVALPSLPEQKRIVAKIDQLMGLCDSLEQSIQQNQQFTQELMQVALREALEARE